MKTEGADAIIRLTQIVKGNFDEKQFPVLNSEQMKVLNISFDPFPILFIFPSSSF